MSTEPEPYDFSLILANSVHDMKNSVGMLIGALDELGAGETAASDPAVRDMSKLRYEAKRLNSNLIQLLSLYRINELGYALNLMENDVEEVVEECFRGKQEAFMQLQGVDSRMDLDPDLVLVL
ncbi:hypothetical protein [Thiohalobacter thiocyanaticus]|uniref:Signal transduction histidine kinase n=1 Tax=Thiohalobacter thiocyanaticus TaxID=585455 RepID=A0A426QJ55_9GAMM|nr:hypothetical protein [Thiohalobacter thiocyanaticus]RRQ21794.1 hypothetical protein D6C00_07430 [Thiohalobacter thiocyanaticus]